MKCFVIMPFGNDRVDAIAAHQFDCIYSQWIKPAVEDIMLTGQQRVECNRADKEIRPGEIIAQVIESLSDADIVIADLTGKNPNVFYELGVRHSLSNGTILIAQDIEDVPFDLRGMRTICYRYEPESLLTLRSRLQESVKILVSTTPQIDNPVRRFLYEREVAKLVTSPSPPGYDALRQLVDEMQIIRNDLAERVVEVRTIVEYTTSLVSSSDVRTTDWSTFEGAWTSVQHGGLYILEVVGTELRGPYCYGADDELTAHFYNAVALGDKLMCRFSWFDSDIEGFAMLRILDANTATGGWWYAEDVPRHLRADLRHIDENISSIDPPMIPLTLVRVPTPDPLPEWAIGYFDQVAHGLL